MSSHRHPAAMDLALGRTVMHIEMPEFVWAKVHPVPCAHVADYYDQRWLGHKCIAWQLLRRGYRQWSEGLIEQGNNLFEYSR